MESTNNSLSFSALPETASRVLSLEVGQRTPAANVSVIVLNWNGWKDTLECLHSLQNLEYPSYQVIVVDNCSTDDSVFRIRQHFPDIQIIETGKNLGFAAGCNAGIARALAQRAEYVWLLNNDTTVDQN